MPRFRVKVSFSRKSETELSIRASDTMSARQKATEVVTKWQEVQPNSVKVSECVVDG